MYRQYLIRFGLLLLALSLLSACGGGSSKHSASHNSQSLNNSAPTPAVEDIAHPQQPDPEPDAAPPLELPASAKMTLSGRITYDRVPFDARLFRGLDYSRTEIAPARGVTVQLVDGTNRVRHTGQTDTDGYYRFSIDRQQSLRVRVLAELRGDSQAAWDIQVRDNTSGNAQYVLDGSLSSVGDGDRQTRHLHAPSGWTGEHYGAPRSAAPFAVLDSIYDAVQMVVSAQPDVVLPPLTVYWSEKNIATSGNSNDGHIGTSYYTSAGPAIYLLGAADNDSDEYDRGVVQHEFGHYIEHQLARTESIGGSHGQLSRLDMRVAFGEAWGNAFAGMVSGDPLYRDSYGTKQTYVFNINVENRSYSNPGWFSEASIQAFLYDLFDANNDASDSLSLGFKPIYDVITSDRYLSFDGFASIFAFRAELERQNPAVASEVATMLASYNIYGKGWYGEGETNNGGSPSTLPVYHQMTLGQPTNVCSNSDFQKYNGVDVRRFLRVHLPDTRHYSISAVRSGGDLWRSNPQVRIYHRGNLMVSLTSGTTDREIAQRHLARGDYVLEVYEESNAEHTSSTGGFVCFDVTVQ